MNSGKAPETEVYRAGQSAIKLLKMLVAESSPRSDTPKIKAEIARIEKVFDEKAAANNTFR